MNISIFGLGYVGCVSLGCLARDGHRVIGVDVAENKVNLINNGKTTIVEAEIDKIINENWKKKRIFSTTDYKKAVLETDISMICVGTPGTDQGHLNLKHVFNTARDIGEALKEKENFHIIVIRSTVLPGTNKKFGELVEKTSGKKRNVHFAVVSNPEFMREGSAVNDYYNPSLIVLGSDNENALKTIREIYKEIDAPIEYTEIEVSEIIKYVNNSFHALKVSFANEVGNICKKLEIDSHKVMNLFCKDTRLNISPYYFKPGFAYGGSCLPKDLKGLTTLAHDFYLSLPILESIELSNRNQKEIGLDMIINKGKKKIGILGFSFKKGTDDLRYSPIVEIIERLLGKGYDILIYDEKVNLSKISGTNKEYIDKHIPHLSNLISGDFDYVVSNSELLVVSHDDDKFRNLIEKSTNKIFVDLTRISNKRSGGNYDGICW